MNDSIKDFFIGRDRYRGRQYVEFFFLDTFSIKSTDLYKKGRTRESFYPRITAFYLLSKYFNLGFSEIARIFKVNHSTVIRGVAYFKSLDGHSYIDNMFESYMQSHFPSHFQKISVDKSVENPVNKDCVKSGELVRFFNAQSHPHLSSFRAVEVKVSEYI